DTERLRPGRATSWCAPTRSVRPPTWPGAISVSGMETTSVIGGQVGLDGGQDVLGARAPAQDAGELLLERLARDVEPALAQRHRGEDEGRRAVAALQAVGLFER